MRENNLNKKISGLICFIFICSQIFSQSIDTLNFNYNEGIYTEKTSDTISETRYTDDNLIYKANNKYIFSYKYIDNTGKIFLYERTKNEWRFIPIDSISNNTVVNIELSVKPDFGLFVKYKSTYEQSVIRYLYLSQDDKVLASESTGLIENLKNIWMHPPRTDLFKILELNPFPFIQFPSKKDKNWNWKLIIGKAWSDSRWKLWEGQITNNYSYTIEDTNKTFSSPQGEIKCLVIKSVANSEIGSTFLTAYFSDIYGFVYLEYTNIDNSKIILKLNKILNNTNHK
jgi:hypothetical protein